MGTIAGAGDSVKAQRAKAADDTNRDKDSLTTKRAERAKLDARPLPAIQADLTTVADDIFALKAGLAEALANLGGR